MGAWLLEEVLEVQECGVYSGNGGTGGSSIVLIRYRFNNYDKYNYGKQHTKSMRS